MDDLDASKQRLRTRNLSLVFVKNSKVIFETDRGGLLGFLEAISELRDDLAEASVADRIIGKAAALLCAYSRVKAAFAVTLSDGGLSVLRDNHIPCEYGELVPSIHNLERTDQCPFEKLVENVNNPKEAYQMITLACKRQSHTAPELHAAENHTINCDASDLKDEHYSS